MSILCLLSGSPYLGINDNMDKKLLIIDGLNLIRRLYAALEAEADLVRRVERTQSIAIEALNKFS